MTVRKEAVLKQSSRKLLKDETAALLVRISRDDGEDSESNSIQNQKALLTKIAKEKGYTEFLVFSEAADIIEPTQRNLATATVSEGLVFFVLPQIPKREEIRHQHSRRWSVW